MSTQDFRSEAAYQYEPIVDIADLDYRHAKRAPSPSKARRNTPREVSEEHNHLSLKRIIFVYRKKKKQKHRQQKGEKLGLFIFCITV